MDFSFGISISKENKKIEKLKLYINYNNCMPKNDKKSGNKRSTRSTTQLLIQEPGQKYAEVTRTMGNCQFLVKFLNGEEGTASLKGSMKGGKGFERVSVGNWVLTQKDENTTGKDKYFIIHLYSQNDKKQLEKLGELKSAIKTEVDETAFVFEGDEVLNVAKESTIDESFINDL